ncbi:Uncharacterised protein [Vibrio cholerae]|nr:Uncharacterised protein [Vibrio cholerae]
MLGILSPKFGAEIGQYPLLIMAMDITGGFQILKQLFSILLALFCQGGGGKFVGHTEIPLCLCSIQA